MDTTLTTCWNMKGHKWIGESDGLNHGSKVTKHPKNL